MLIAQTGGLDSVVRLITVFLLFFFVLGITYFTSRYVATFQKKRMGSANIEIIEAARISQTVVLEIIRAGGKYLLIAVAKDNVTMLTELSEDELSLGENVSLTADKFQAVLGKAAEKIGRKKDRDQSNDEDGTQE